MRAGAQTLTLLGTPRNYLILRALEEGAQGQLGLRRAAGSPAQSTLRGVLKTLEATGVIIRRKREAFPGSLEYGLSESGESLLAVADCLDTWLAQAPNGPLRPGTDAARAAVKGLVDGWVARLLAPLADAPRSLTQLDMQLSEVSYPTIERCLETMRLADQLEVGRRERRGTPYEATDWLRRGVAPLVAAARWELRGELDESAPMNRRDVEDAFSTVSSLLDLPAGLSGTCQLAARARDGDEKPRRFLGLIELQAGKASFDGVYPGRKPDAWAAAKVETWFAVLLEGQTRGLRLSGAHELPEALIAALRRALFEREAGEPGNSPSHESAVRSSKS